MPFVSLAQMRKFAELHKEGKISRATFMEWWHHTNFDDIPDKIKNNMPKVNGKKFPYTAKGKAAAKKEEKKMKKKK